jgi:hypothetical protein
MTPLGVGAAQARHAWRVFRVGITLVLVIILILAAGHPHTSREIPSRQACRPLAHQLRELPYGVPEQVDVKGHDDQWYRHGSRDADCEPGSVYSARGVTSTRRAILTYVSCCGVQTPGDAVTLSWEGCDTDS